MIRPDWPRQRTCRGTACVSVVFALTGFLAAALAEVVPHALFSEGVVLQQSMEVPVWGTAADGEEVTVTLQAQKVSTNAKDGRWLVRLKPLKAGGPFTLTIAGKNTITLTNVLVGEVWLCSGQSNMVWPVRDADNAKEAVAAADDPLLRLAQVPRAATDEPLRTVDLKWTACTTNAVRGFSAVGYFFGRDLRKALNVPVGLIESAFGGTPIQAWTSRAALESEPAAREAFQRHAEAIQNFPNTQKRYEQLAAKHQEAVEQAKKEGKEPPRPPRKPVPPAKSPKRPAGLYNAMITPLQPFTIRGAIWYQGEGNAARAADYRKLLPLLIRTWREAWGQEFSFLIVQLPGYQQIVAEPGESPWAEMRESQLLTSQRVPKTGLAVITDCGSETNIHPRKKEPVGARLALAARAIAYGEKLVYSGPLYDSLKVEGDQAIVSFQHIGGGLLAKDGELKGFTLCGEDRKFVNARAVIKGQTVVVSSLQVPKPVAVRFGWANYPVVNLYNKEGLPASPFRTDDFPMITAPTDAPGSKEP